MRFLAKTTYTVQRHLPRESSLEFIRAKHSESNTVVAHYKDKNNMHSFYAIRCFLKLNLLMVTIVKPLHKDLTIVQTTLYKLLKNSLGLTENCFHIRSAIKPVFEKILASISFTVTSGII